MAEVTYSLLDGLEAASFGSITSALSDTSIPPADSAHLDKVERLIQCAEVVAAIVHGDDIARDSVDNYEGLNGYRRGALLNGVMAMLEAAGREVHLFATGYARHCEASADRGGRGNG